MKLVTTDSELHTLQTILDNTRRSSEQITVPKEALRHLILDHFELYSKATSKGHKVELGVDQESMKGDAA